MGGGGFGQTYLGQDLQLPDRDYCVAKSSSPKPLMSLPSRRGGVYLMQKPEPCIA